MKTKLGAIARRTLDTPNCSGILARLGSIYSTFSRGRYTPIFTQEGLWVHQCSDGCIVDRYVNFSATLAHYRAKTAHNWCSLYRPKPGDIVLDIGAGIGTEAAYFSPEIGTEGIMLSVEAHPETFRALELFCRLNGFGNVACIQSAVTDSDQQVLIDNPSSYLGSSIVEVQSGVSVPGTTLDRLVEDFHLPRIDFIKMNVEGAEQYALRGMVETLKHTHYICIACHDFKAGRSGSEGFRTKSIVTTFLKERGFETFERNDDARPWILDQVNAVNRNLVCA